MSNPHADARDEWVEKASEFGLFDSYPQVQAAAAIAQVHALAYIGDALTDILDQFETCIAELRASTAERAEQAQDLRNTIAELRGT